MDDLRIVKNKKDLRIQIPNLTYVDEFILYQYEHDKKYISCKENKRKKLEFIYDVSNFICLKEYLILSNLQMEAMWKLLKYLCFFFSEMQEFLYFHIDLDYIYIEENTNHVYLLGIPENKKLNLSDEISLLENIIHFLPIKKNLKLYKIYVRLQNNNNLSFAHVYQKMLYQEKTLISKLTNREQPMETYVFQEVMKQETRIEHPVNKKRKQQKADTLSIFEKRQKAYLQDMKDNEIEISSNYFTIGRNSTSDLVIKAKNVSLNHAVIFYEHAVFYLIDEYSSNGTFVNEQKVMNKIKLMNGMKIRFANKLYIFYIKD